VLQGYEMDEIRRLRREGLTISAVTALTGHDRQTVRRHLDETITRPTRRQRPARVSKLAAYTDYLEGRLQRGVWNAVVLLRELRERGYTGRYTISRDWLAPGGRRPARWRC
jgi:transposase